MCETVDVPGLGRVIVCGGHRDRRQAPPCVHCGEPSEVLCDHRNTPEPGLRLATCSAPLCRGCALHVGKNRDYCRTHARAHRPEPVLPFE